MIASTTFGFFACIFLFGRVDAGNFFRVEIDFIFFEHTAQTIHNGKWCDSFTKCDPRLYAYMDIDRPDAHYPGSARSLSQFTLFLDHMDTVVATPFKPRIVKNICDRKTMPTSVNVRVEAYDYDYFTGNDLIDNLDCKFSFDTTPRHEMRWSDLEKCKPTYHPYMRLMYRHRIFPITAAECNYDMELPLVFTTTTRKTTTRPTTTTTKSTTTRTTTTTTTPTTPSQNATMYSTNPSTDMDNNNEDARLPSGYDSNDYGDVYQLNRIHAMN